MPGRTALPPAGRTPPPRSPGGSGRGVAGGKDRGLEAEKVGKALGRARGRGTGTEEERGEAAPEHREEPEEICWRRFRRLRGRGGRRTREGSTAPGYR